MQNAPAAIPPDSGDPIVALLRACNAMQRGELAKAAADVDWVLGRSEDPDLRLPAARLAGCTGQYDRALDELFAIAARHERQASSALEAALDLALRVGWEQDARRALEAAFELRPSDNRLQRVAVRLFGPRAPELAIQHAEHALAIDPDQPALRLELANLAADTGDVEATRREVELALARETRRPFMLEGARVLFDVADIAAARKLLAALLARDARDWDAKLALARLELATGRPAVARSLAGELVEARANEAGALGVLGALALIEGRAEEAWQLLERATELDQSSDEMFAWRAEAKLALGDREGCRSDAHRASMLGGHPVPARVLHLLASTGPNDRAPRVFAERLENVRAALLELCPDGTDALDSELHERVVPVLWRALQRLGSNRTASPTWIDDAGTLHRLKARAGVRSACRAALERIRCQPQDVVFQHLDELVHHHHSSALPLCHRGELALWIGDTARARADFDAAIGLRRETRFAYIGLAGCALLEGDAERAIEECERGVRAMHGSEGPALLAYRGEALARLGRIEAARRDLERALLLSPSRLGSRIALAALPDGDASANYEAIAELAPGLVSDAAHGIAAVSYRTETAPEKRRAIVERALRMLRGNRSSSCYTYFTDRGPLRSIPGHGGQHAKPHERDAREVERIEAVLRARLARNARRGNGATRAETPARVEPPAAEPLDGESVERFLNDGYIALRAAIPREVCEALVDRLHVRLTTAPERWVRRADPETLAALLKLRPEDPGSWPAARLDVEGERALPIAELSPRVWGAICQLLGGAERVQTRSFFDAFVLNLRDLADSGWAAPSPTQDSWHYDDPREADTLAELDRGLIAIIYLSDVGPRCGGTFVAPESVPLTIRWMNDNPAGVDLITRSSGPRIAGACSRFDELTGQAGDVFLLHPLMVHSSSANTSGRVRYMTNPMVYLREALRITDSMERASPLEESFRRALRRSGT